MDGGINDLLNAFLNNPEMIKKAMNILSPTSAGDIKNQSSPEDTAVPVFSPQTETPQTPVSGAPDISSDQLAAMVNSVMSALGMNGAGQPHAPQDIPGHDIPSADEENPSVPQSDNPQNTTPDSPNFDIEKALGVLKNVSKETSPQKDNRIQLLLALKPFLKEGRKQKIDMAVKYLNAAKIFNMFGKNGFI